MIRPIMRRVIVWTFLCCFVAAVSNARWYGPADSRERAVLQSWDAKTLFTEAFDVCVRRAQLKQQTPSPEQAQILNAAEQYLSLIEEVVREQTGGRVPQWLRSLSFASTSRDCQAVFRSFLGEEAPPETKPAELVPGSQAPTVDDGPPRLPQRREVVPPPRKPPTRTPTNTAVIRIPGFPILWFTPTPQQRGVRSRPSPSPRPTRTQSEEGRVRTVIPAQPRGKAATPVPDVSDELPPWFY